MIHGILLVVSFGGIVWGILSVIAFFVTLLMTAVILIQDSKDTGLTSAFGGAGGSNALLGARMQRDLAKITAILGGVLAVCLLIMGMITRSQLGQSIGELGAGAPRSDTSLPAEAPPPDFPGDSAIPPPIDPIPAVNPAGTPSDTAPIPTGTAPTPTETAPGAPTGAAPAATPVVPTETAPATPTETAPAAPTDTAPAAPTDTAPAAPTETAPAAPTETAPAAPTDTAPAAPTDTAPGTKQEGVGSTPKE